MLVSLIATVVFSGPANSGVLVVDNLAIGRLDAGKWRDVVPDSRDPISKLRSLDFQEIGLGNAGAHFKKPRMELLLDAAPGWYFNSPQVANRVLWSGAVKVAKLERLSKTAPIYLETVRAHLAKHGLRKVAPKIQAAFRVDLDSDGTREVLIEAAPLADMVGQTMENSTAAHYSSLLLVRTKKGHAQTLELAHYDGRAGGLEGACRLRSIADFDGDGKFEIVTSTNYYEGTSATVWSFRRGAIRQLVSNGSGL